MTNRCCADNVGDFNNPVRSASSIGVAIATGGVRRLRAKGARGGAPAVVFALYSNLEATAIVLVALQSHAVQFENKDGLTTVLCKVPQAPRSKCA